MSGVLVTDVPGEEQWTCTKRRLDQGGIRGVIRLTDLLARIHLHRQAARNHGIHGYHATLIHPELRIKLEYLA